MNFFEMQETYGIVKYSRSPLSSPIWYYSVGYCNYSKCYTWMCSLYYSVSMFSSSYILVYEVGSAEKW